MEITYCTNRCPGGNSPFFKDNVILIQGFIEKNDSKKFDNLVNSLSEEKKTNLYVFINSPGGEISQCLIIGQKIHDFGFNTYFSSEYYDLYLPDNSELKYNSVAEEHFLEHFGFSTSKILPRSMNACISEAIFIYLGGIKRELGEYNPYSFFIERNRKEENNKFINSSSTQINSYLNLVEVRGEILIYFLYHKRNLNVFDIEQLFSFNIVNVNKPAVQLYTNNGLNFEITNTFSKVNVVIENNKEENNDTVILKINYGEIITDLEEDYEYIIMKINDYEVKGKIADNIIYGLFKKDCFFRSMNEEKENYNLFSITGFPQSSIRLQHFFSLTGKDLSVLLLN